MRSNFTILICFFFLSFNKKPVECNKLKNGKYHVEFIGSFNPPYKNYDIIIKDESYKAYLENGDSAIGKIEWIYECTFKLKSSYEAVSDSSTEFSKLIQKSFGEVCMEIKEVRGDTINFRTTYTANLHITLNEGRLIKLIE
jgi:hypothetical protein